MGTQKHHLNENPKHMFKLMGKEIYAILGAQMILILTYVIRLVWASTQVLYGNKPPANSHADLSNRMTSA